MKLSEIYAKSKAWMFEKKSSTIYNDYIVEIANKIIAELYEENNKLYRYWVEEVKIGDDDITTVTNLNTRKVTSDNSDYIISYSRDFVPTNTEETPILVKNEYMWYKLPATGGSGTGRIYFLGGIFTAIGIISGSVFYRRKRRRV